MVTTKRIFADRAEAGIELGKLLQGKYKNKNALVLGVPRGGVIVACEVAGMLNAELSVVITKKLPHPHHHNRDVGAVAEDGSFFSSNVSDLDRNQVNQIHTQQLREIGSRVQTFRNGKPLPAMANRVVIIVDDAIATGSTIVPVIKLCQSRNAAHVIVAAPVSSRSYVSEINMLADEVVIAAQCADFYAVGQYYQDFQVLSDSHVVEKLNRCQPVYRRRI
ncbi:MAG TPA: phosphoribosyltransferase family protein [Chryseosolibacter sp.]|nr:phosphoribosyltransferase family protein [Chryseosolibacter sp.]